VLVMLALQELPGPLDSTLLLGSIDGIVIGLVLLQWRTGGSASQRVVTQALASSGEHIPPNLKSEGGGWRMLYSRTIRHLPSAILQQGLEGIRRAISTNWSLWVLCALLVLAACMRLPNLGYSEFHSDEARAVLLATAVVDGQDGILLAHRKGPAEVLL